MNQSAQEYQDTSFFGHPKGLMTLFFTEMWERMSYYGMRGLLVLYMTIGVAGNPGMEWSNVQANAIYGIYAGMVYFLAVPGGWLADNLLGYQRAVMIGALIITLGHFTLAIPLEQTFILGLVFVAVGTGLLKPNISTIVGQLYQSNDSRRDAGYTIFYMSINIGSMLGFFVCGWLGEKIGWHWGFGAAGIGMLAGVIQFIYFKKFLGSAGLEPVPMEERKRELYKIISLAVSVIPAVLVVTGLMGLWSIDPVFFAERFRDFLIAISAIYFFYLFFLANLSRDEKKNVLMLMLLFLGAAAFWSGFDQSAGSFTIFTRDYVNLYWVPVSWTQIANPLFIVIFAPFFANLWVFLGKRNLDPSTPIKFAIGLLFMALGFIVMIFAVKLALAESSVGVQWLLITYLIHTFGELALSPVGLSAFSKYSPKRYAGQMMGIWFLASSLGGVLAGLLGGEATESGLDSMSPVFEQLVIYCLVLAVALFALSFVVKGKELSDDDLQRWVPDKEELSDKEFWPTLIFCLFLGFLGIHRMYVGKIATGVIMLFLWFISIILAISGIFLWGAFFAWYFIFTVLLIWELIDFVRICTGKFGDSKGRIVKYRGRVKETGIAEELEKFNVLKEKGIISEEDFNKKKDELLK